MHGVIHSHCSTNKSNRHKISHKSTKSQSLLCPQDDSLDIKTGQPIVLSLLELYIRNAYNKYTHSSQLQNQQSDIHAAEHLRDTSY